MRKSIAAAALIRERLEGRLVWLTQWSRSWHCYHLVGGHKKDDESFRDCLVREIHEELGLKEHQDYDMAAEPTAHLEFTAWSERANQETAYTTELFEVRLHSGAARDKVDADADNRWLSEPEITAGQCTDGKPISATMKLLLSRINSPR